MQDLDCGYQPPVVDHGLVVVDPIWVLACECPIEAGEGSAGFVPGLGRDGRKAGSALGDDVSLAVLVQGLVGQASLQWVTCCSRASTSAAIEPWQAASSVGPSRRTGPLAVSAITAGARSPIAALTDSG
jgi:hypothetical protein